MPPRGRPSGPARPAPTLTEARGAAERIVDRRVRAEDPDLELLPDEGDLFGLLPYLRTHARVSADVLRAEVPDALIIVRYLRAALDGEELAQIRRGRGAGMTWTALGESLGLRNRQGAEQRALSLEGGVRGREDGESLRHPAPVRGRRRAEDTMSDWLVRHERRVRAAASALVEMRAELCPDEETGEWLDDLGERLESPARSGGERRSLVSCLHVTVVQVREALVERGLSVSAEAEAALRSARDVLDEVEAAERAAERLRR